MSGTRSDGATRPRSDSPAATGLQAVDGPGRRLALGLALLCTGLFLLTTRGVQVADNLVHADGAIGLVERGALTLSFDPKDPALATRRPDGRVVSSLGPGLALVSAPFVAAGSGVRRLTAGRGPDALPAALAGAMERVPRPTLVVRFRRINADPRLVAFSLLNPLLAGATVLLVVWLALALGLPARAATWAGLFLALGSPLLVYAGTGWTQPLVTFALTAAVAALLIFVRAPGWRPALGVGAGFGLAVLTRLDALVYGLPVGLLLGVALWQARRAGRVRLGPCLAAALAPVGLALGAWLLWNLWRFGQPVGPAAAWQAGGWQPGAFARGVVGLLASPEDGLLLYAPFALLVPWGALYLRRAGGPRAWLVGLALAVLGLQLLLYGAWWDWRSNLSYGPRYLVPALPLLALVAAAAAERPGRGWRFLPGAALGLGLLAQIPGALLGPLKLPEVAQWAELSWGVGWLALGGGHFAVPGAGSLWGDVVDCRSGVSPVIAGLGVIALGLGLAVLWRRRSRRA